MSVTLEQDSRLRAPERHVGSGPKAAGRDPSTWAPNEHINRRSSIPFILLHFLPLLAIFTGVTWRAVLLGVILYFIRMVAITGGYHRYFSHRSYRLGRGSAVRARVHRHDRRAEGPAVVGGAPPRGPQELRHRARHPFADPRLLVEPCRLDPLRQVQQDRQRRDQGLHPLSRAACGSTSTTGSGRGASASPAISSRVGAVSSIGFFASTIVLWHATFCVNSLAHVFGRRVLRHVRHEPELCHRRPDHER